MIKILKSFLKRLTNLSGSNRSLLLLKLSEEQDLDLNELDFINGKPSFHLIEELIAEKKNIKLCSLVDSRNEKVNKLSNKLKAIDRRERFIFEERGSKDLYVGWPFVKGKLSDGSSVRCPLLFFPVDIAIEGAHWVLNLRDDVPVSFNKSFLLAYSHYNTIPLSDEFLEASFEEFNRDSQIFRTELYTLLKESLVEINFNQDLFINKLVSFDNYKKAAYEELYVIGELKLSSEAVLGIFPQSDSYLVPDYDVLINNSTDKDLEEFFLQRSTEGTLSNSIKEEHTITPLPMDASQENAILSAKQGKSLVVQGPPGTGKSQLISNLIADYIARGKNVLLVCQKRAALDVVHKRLKGLGLEDFIGLVHDFKNDRKDIYKQLTNQIDNLSSYKQRNNSLDSIYLERTFVQTCRRIEQLVEELDEFKSALYNEEDCGMSVKELYLSCDPAKTKVDFQQEYKYFKNTEIKEFTRRLKTLLPYALRFEKQNYLWNDRVSFSEFAASDKKVIRQLLEEIPYYQSELSERLRELLSASLELEEIEWLYDRKDRITQLLELIEDPKSYTNFVYFLNKNTDRDWLIIKEKKISECFREVGMEESVDVESLGKAQAALENARLAKGNLWKWVKWSLFSKDKYLLKRVFASNKLKWNKAAIEEMMVKIDNRLNFEHQHTELRACGWLQDVPEVKSLNAFSEWFHHQHTALEAKVLLKELRGLKEYLTIPLLNYAELKSKMYSLLEIIDEVPAVKRKWLLYLTPRQVSKILNAFEYSVELSDILKKDFESLVEYDRLKAQMTSIEKAVYSKLLSHCDSKILDDYIDLFENSVKLEWIDAIETKYPSLRYVSSLRMEQMEKELQECVEQKRKLSSKILLMNVRERTYSTVEYNRLDNMVTYRDLKHQVTKKKMIWPIRKVIGNFANEVFQLMPCWLASPESVSSIFSMDIKFDLVIFDEASQCFSENGVPSIHRGKQIVITGDGKQLPPSDLYTIRWEEDDEIPDLEIDSLLDLGKKYLKEVTLTGHYRSQSLDLIDFSNRHFYGHKLSMIPHFKEVNNYEPAIKFIKVNGVWENNTNRIEAEKIVELIAKLRSESPDKSLGVVTFNYKQQLLIQDLIEEKLKIVDPELILVKNIENIQGDERDIILFSLGYAPTSSGRLVMNFGSLNATLGENRLNVAITRAREKIYLVSSILPEQMDVSESKNEGPRVLKQYIQYAQEVSDKKFKPTTPLYEVRNSDWYLKSKLEKLKFKYTLSTELPFADLTVKDKSNYCGLIVTDDDLYYHSYSSKEEHAYMPMILQKKNWKYKKIYSRLFWEDRQEVEEGLTKTFGGHA